MTSLFDPLTAGALQLKNRIVMAPLTRNRSSNGIPTELNRLYYTQRASAGLIIAEATAISRQAQGYANVPGLYTEEQATGWKHITDAVHAAGGAIAVQLWHAGRISHSSLQPGGQPPVAPSAIAAQGKTYLVNTHGVGHFVPTSSPRELRIDEIPGLINSFRQATRIAIQAGFDGVEIHAANGYLIDQFLRSGSNRRKDAYGGIISHRIRLLQEIMEAVTAEAGTGRVGVRISPVTPTNDAFDPNPQQLFETVVAMLAHWPLAYIHVIEGSAGQQRDYTQGNTAFDYHALRTVYQQQGGQAAWMVNNGYDAAMAGHALRNREADLVSFGRPFISNPDLVRRIAENRPLNAIDYTTLYGGGEKGYTDYPFISEPPGNTRE